MLDENSKKENPVAQVNHMSGAVGTPQRRAFSLSGLFSSASEMKE